MTLISVFPPAGLRYYLVLSSLCCIGKIWNSLSLGHYLLKKKNVVWKNSCYLILGPVCLIKLGIFSSRKKIEGGGVGKMGYISMWKKCLVGGHSDSCSFYSFKTCVSCRGAGWGNVWFWNFYVSCLVVLNFNSSLGNSGWAHSVRIYVS